ncbi:hypothetical protein JCM19296_1834 [Nonlabens ulvanivorans]|uniref:Uncharacterized protein n=1 Tax=Nonlabens ulvanivorans TaxID=906888 RepID=A0A081DBE1_NONUL|nr:hypothetical protein JCM19296_1834 [Nonlabens ulvanivorans]
MLGTFYDDNNFLINKIQVSSRRPKDNTFNGTIYIVEDDWTIYGVELTTRGENINVPIIEELVFNQSFTYEEASGDWIKRSQSIDFQFAFFGFKGYGRFIANYTNYDFKPQFDKKYFGPEVLSFADGANKKDSTYWNAKRPTPLTVAETDEYVKKDSISAVRNDPKYKDSVDAVNNKLDLLEILTGYTYRNSNNRSSIGYKGVTDFKGFNTVQGYVLGTGLFYSKGYDEDYNKYLYASVDADYGFSDDRVRYNASIYYRFNRTNRRSCDCLVVPLYSKSITVILYRRWKTRYPAYCLNAIMPNSMKSIMPELAIVKNSSTDYLQTLMSVMKDASR